MRALPDAVQSAVGAGVVVPARVPTDAPGAVDRAGAVGWAGVPDGPGSCAGEAGAAALTAGTAVEVEAPALVVPSGPQAVKVRAARPNVTAVASEEQRADITGSPEGVRTDCPAGQSPS
ncbi:hypothetical protein GCM10010442_64330 [Kitasatospora kifunensis]